MADARDNSPWIAVILCGFAVGMAVCGVRILRASVVVASDRLGVPRVFTGDDAAIFAWFYIGAAVALILAVVAMIRRRERRP